MNSFADGDNIADLLVFQGAQEMGALASLDSEMVNALEKWKHRPQRSDTGLEHLKINDVLCFAIDYQGNSSGHWPSKDATVLPETLIRTFLFHNGICDLSDPSAMLYFQASYKILALDGVEHLLVCAYPTPSGNIGGLVVICVNNRLI
ncbi:hypothetical protein ABLN87_15365 [Ruegeria sp. SCPT10]|uniref:hypothetical protein n=1 Tax=Ruegeria sp. SCP10 TaxID=3141377 RepID=UPI003338C5D6